MEKQLLKVTFEFADNTKRILTGEELDSWEAICSGYSDYLLPGDSDHVLAVGYGGLVRGFVPPVAIGRPRPETKTNAELAKGG